MFPTPGPSASSPQGANGDSDGCSLNTAMWDAKTGTVAETSRKIFDWITHA
ncbi:hypothetical protein [Nakamurella antarctica]|uniref:hypothetical protein n=1 Tax=Nakamurella antarctica TaxID=1902245 RepID=UPI0013DD93F1|nr:hypothetical protein [Nakamurella antarctica]